MTKLYINADPGHPEITAQSVLDSGADGARMVLLPHPERIAFADELHKAGKDVIGIMVAGESDIYAGLGSPKAAARWYHDNFGGTISILQIANEPDLEATWMEPADLLSYTYDVLSGWGPRFGIPVWGPGLASGNPAYLDPIKDEFFRLIDCLALHPYGRSPDGVLPGPFGTIDDLVTAYGYLSNLSLPFVFSEWGIKAEDAEDDAERARYVTAMILRMQELRIDSALFSLGPMVPEFDLRDANGEPNALYPAFANSFS